jgi:hypothetical protein
MGIVVVKVDWNDERVLMELEDIEYETGMTEFDHGYSDGYGFLLPLMFGANCYGDGGHDEYAVVQCESELYVVTLVSYE